MFLQSNNKKQNIDSKRQPYICCVFRKERTQTTFKDPLLFLEIINYQFPFLQLNAFQKSLTSTMSKNKNLFNDIKTPSIKANLKQQPYIYKV